MKLIIGLGNFEPKYFFTRHNVGFMLLDYLCRSNSQEFRTEKKLKSMISKFSIRGEEIILVKPLTYMNLSGEALSLVMNYYKISRAEVLVVYDDISLDLGRVRFRDSGSDGGHNGIKSIISHIGGKDFDRLKVGIGPQSNIASEAYVLQNFTHEELEKLKDVIRLPLVEDYLSEGLQKVQNKYN